MSTKGSAELYRDHTHTRTHYTVYLGEQEPGFYPHPPPPLLAWQAVDLPGSCGRNTDRDKEKVSYVQQVESQMIFPPKFSFLVSDCLLDKNPQLTQGPQRCPQ